MLPRYLLGPAVILLWQVAPVTIAQDPSGQWRVSFGVSRGDYEERTIDCAGEVTDRQSVTFTVVGGVAEYWIDRNFRLEVEGGSVAADAKAGTIVIDPYAGGFGKALVAYERKVVGVGVGLALNPPDPWDNPGGGSRLLPASYLRLGSEYGLQGRIEVGGAAYPGGPPDRGRMSFGQEGRTARSASWRISVVVQDFPLNGSDDVGYSARLMVPLGGRFELGAGASSHTGGVSGGLFGRLTVGSRQPDR